MIAYIDMDHTACDFDQQYHKYLKLYPNVQWPQSVVGFFSTMVPIQGFLEFWHMFTERGHDLRIATRPSYYNLHNYTEKALWIREHLGFKALEKLYMTPDKSALKGDYLIDDGLNDGQPDFEGEHILFGHDHKTWIDVATYLIGEGL